MKRLICMAAIALIASATAALAQGPTHDSGGLGFHRTEAPIGLRWWFNNQQLALDAGVGFGSTEEEVPGGTETLSNWAIDVGVPIRLRSWDKVHFMARPGILYTSQERFSVPLDDTDTETVFTVLGELEAEIFLADNVSVSASHGIGFENINPAFGGDSTTNWSTFGANFTEVGFHVYLFGGGK